MKYKYDAKQNLLQYKIQYNTKYDTIKKMIQYKNIKIKTQKTNCIKTQENHERYIG